MSEEVAVDNSIEENAFEAGFNATDITPVEPAKTAGDNLTDKETPVKVDPPQVKTLTEDDMKAALNGMRGEFARGLDKAFGTIGEVKQRLMEVQALRETAAGISPKARERLRGEFPELEALLFDPEDAPAEKAEPVKAPAKEETKGKATDTDKDGFTPEQVMERRLLKRDHPDWESVAGSAEFITWCEQLPASEREALQSTWDADLVSRKLTDFKEWKTKVLNNKNEGNKIKKERIDAAVTPRGLSNQSEFSSDSDDEEAAMERAFKNCR